MKISETKSKTKKTFCRVVFAKSWRGFSEDDYFDTNNEDDVSSFQHGPTLANMYWVHGLGYIPRDVVKEVQIVEATTTTVTIVMHEVIDTMSFTC